jgi:hypothetical protein
MGMKNHPNDTRCKRHLSRTSVGAAGWLAHKYTGPDRERLLGYVKALTAAGAKDIWVGTLAEHDDGTEHVESLWVALAQDDKQDKKLKAKIIEIETTQEFESPGEGIGFTFAEVTCG